MVTLLYVRHVLLVAAVTVATTSVASAQTSVLVLDYSNAKTFGNVHIAGGAIDLTSGAMIVTTSSFGFVPSGGQTNERGVPGVAEYGDNAIHDALAEGANYASGFWNGTNGIISSTAANDPNAITAFGWIDDSVTGYTVFEGIPVNTNQSIIATTWYGDSLLTGAVTPDDYALWLATITNPAGADVSTITGGPIEWLDGDWFQSGVATSDDYGLWLASITSPAMKPRNFNPSAPNVPGDGANAAAVPEPASIFLSSAAFLASVFIRRLRRTTARL
jgi:hypothetical protein